MIYRADAYVRNNSNLIDTLNVVSMHRYTKMQETTVNHGNVVRIPLSGPEVSLIISAPGDTDTKRCCIMIESDVDLDMVYSRAERNWTIKILPNELAPDMPTSINITISDAGGEP